MSLPIKDGQKQDTSLKTTLDGSDHVTHHNVDTIIPGTGSTSLGKAEDSAHASGHVGVMMLAVARYAKDVGSGSDGDYSTLNVDGYGNLRVVSGDLRVRLTAVPTTAAGAYAAGDVVGTLMSFSGATTFFGGSGVIENILIADKANVVSNLDFIFFSANPSASTITDNAAYTLDAADFDKIVAAENIDNVFAAAGNRVCKYTPPAGIPFCLTTGTTLYGVLVARTGFTLASSTDLKAILIIRQD